MPHRTNKTKQNNLQHHSSKMKIIFCYFPYKTSEIDFIYKSASHKNHLNLQRLGLQLRNKHENILKTKEIISNFSIKVLQGLNISHEIHEKMRVQATFNYTFKLKFKLTV